MRNVTSVHRSRQPVPMGTGVGRCPVTERIRVLKRYYWIVDEVTVKLRLTGDIPSTRATTFTIVSG